MTIAQCQWNEAETVSNYHNQHMAVDLPPNYNHCGLQTTSACFLSSHTKEIWNQLYNFTCLKVIHKIDY